MILYFSGCGNSKFVAEELARLTNDTLVQIKPLESKPSIALGPNEALGVVCPVYAWAVPRVVSDYINRLTINSKPSYCYLACTCGDNVGRTPERFAKTLKAKGINLDSAFSFVMPETYVNLAGFSLDTPENERRKIDAVRERLPLVAERIQQREKVVDVVRGKVPRLNTYVTNALFYGLLITDKKFTVNDRCISCGLCAKVCPLGNITMTGDYADPQESVKQGLRPLWHGNCTNCMACYHHCPNNAIHFGKATQGKGQYFFSDK